MRSVLFGVFGLLLAAVAGCAGRSSPSTTPSTDALAKQLPTRVHEATLANGLRVLVQEERGASQIALRITYGVGSFADPKGRAGFAHLFEHMMFEGSKHVARGEFETTMGALGGAYNAETTEDYTAYHETFPKAHLEKVLWLESDRMGFLLDALDQKMLDEVRGIVKSEYRQRIEGKPYVSVMPAVAAALFPPEHPYHHAPIGSLAELDAATLADARAFFLRWYAPNNATLVLVGDVDATAVVERVRHWFEAIPRGPTPPQLPELPVPQLPADRRLTFEAGVDLPRVSFSWPTPAFGAPGDAALESAATLLHWRASAALTKDKELAHAVSVRHFPGRFGGTVVMTALLEKTASVDQAVLALDEALDDLSRWARWTMAEKQVKASLYDSFAAEVFDLDGPTRRAASLAFYDYFTHSPTGMLDRLRAYERLDSDEVTDAYRTWLLRRHRVIAVVRPVPSAPVSGRLVEDR